jgi:hypothetical protein
MSAHHASESEKKPDLLQLWLGQTEETPPPRRSPVGSLFRLLVGLAGVVALVLLAKYAVDVLTIVLALLVTGLVLHIVGTKLAQSTLLSPGPIAIAVAVVALLAYAFMAPSDGPVSLPEPVARFLAWSEERGWGHRAFAPEPAPPWNVDRPATAASATPPPTEAPSPSPAGSTGTTGTTGDAAVIPPPSSAPVSLGISSPISQSGQSVVLTARLGEGTERSEIEFYDGTALLGTATVRVEAGARIASLTVALAPGEHTLRAAIPGTWGLWSRRSEPVRHTVR